MTDVHYRMNNSTQNESEEEKAARLREMDKIRVARYRSKWSHEKWERVKLQNRLREQWRVAQMTPKQRAEHRAKNTACKRRSRARAKEKQQRNGVGGNSAAAKSSPLTPASNSLTETTKETRLNRTMLKKEYKNEYWRMCPRCKYPITRRFPAKHGRCPFCGCDLNNLAVDVYYGRYYFENSDWEDWDQNCSDAAI